MNVKKMKTNVSKGFRNTTDRVSSFWNNTAVEVKYGAAAFAGLVAAVAAVVVFKKRK